MNNEPDLCNNIFCTNAELGVPHPLLYRCKRYDVKESDFLAGCVYICASSKCGYIFIFLRPNDWILVWGNGRTEIRRCAWDEVSEENSDCIWNLRALRDHIPFEEELATRDYVKRHVAQNTVPEVHGMNSELANQLGKVAFEGYYSEQGLPEVTWESLNASQQHNWVRAGKAIFTAFVYHETDSRAVNGPETILATRDYVERHVAQNTIPTAVMHKWFTQINDRLEALEKWRKA